MSFTRTQKKKDRQSKKSDVNFNRLDQTTNEKIHEIETRLPEVPSGGGGTSGQL